MAKKAEDIVEETPTTIKKPEAAGRLVKLSKGDEIVEAHPTQVALWQSQGWTVQE